MQIQQTTTVAPIYSEEQAPKQKKKAKKIKSDELSGDQLETSTQKTGTTQSAVPLFTQEESSARQFLDRFSQGAFDPVRSTSDRFVNLKTTHDQKDMAQPGNYQPTQYWAQDEEGYLVAGRVNLNDLSGIENFDDIRNQFRDSLSHHHSVQEALGPNPTDAELDAYIEENYLAIAEIFGYDLDRYYEGFVSMNGDVNAYSSMNERGGVCSDIHAAITAFHTAYGKESYMLMSTGNDYAHVINIFKDDDKWYVQNYDKIVETDAQTIEELYDMVMPENREIKLWSVDESGNMQQVVTDHLTATGRAERRFRAEAGVGNFNPWYAQEGVTVGIDEISVYHNGFYAGINPQENSAAMGAYRIRENGEVRSIEGVALEGQDDTNAYGYTRQHLDGKYEIETRWITDHTYGREHFSVYVGNEGTTMEPAYWGGDEERDAIGRMGVSYARNGSRLYGEKVLKFELGYETKATATLSASINDPLNYQTAGLMYSDAGAEAKVVTGGFFQPTPHLTVRSGLVSGVDLGKIDGTNVSEQLINIAESDAYLDVSLSKGKVAGNVLADVPLHDPTQYKVGVGVAVAPTKQIRLAATYLQEQIVTDRVDSLRVGAEVQPKQNLLVGAGVTTPLVGDNSDNLAVSGYFKVKF